MFKLDKNLSRSFRNYLENYLVNNVLNGSFDPTNPSSHEKIEELLLSSGPASITAKHRNLRVRNELWHSLHRGNFHDELADTFILEHLDMNKKATAEGTVGEKGFTDAIKDGIKGYTSIQTVKLVEGAKSFAKTSLIRWHTKRLYESVVININNQIDANSFAKFLLTKCKVLKEENRTTFSKLYRIVNTVSNFDIFFDRSMISVNVPIKNGTKRVFVTNKNPLSALYTEMGAAPVIRMEYKGCKFWINPDCVLGQSNDNGFPHRVSHTKASPTAAIHWDRGQEVSLEDFVSDYVSFLNDNFSARKGSLNFGKFKIVEHTGTKEYFFSDDEWDRKKREGQSDEMASKNDGIPVSPGLATRTVSSSSEVVSREVWEVSKLLGYALVGMDEADLYFPESSDSGFNNTYYPDDLMETVQDIRTMFSNSAQFRELSLSLNIGVFIYGPPGSGKSTFARSLGMDIGVPVHVIYLAGQTDESFSKAWNTAAAESVTTPVVIVIDDIDATFVGRNARDTKVGLRFETLLNKISGTNTRSNIILIINANDISNVDSAIAQVSDLQLDEFQLPTRPGRIDRIHYLGFMTETGRERLIKRSLVNWPEKWEELVRKTEGFTLAQVYAVCSKVCTQELKQKALNRDERV
jgi:hypothetical protein